jgi:mono/diheme cytochrome c family protein
MLAVGLTLAAGAMSPQTPATPAGDAGNGRKLFDRFGCYECHGHEGQGGAAGARLGPQPIPYAAFSRYVRHPARQMPPYTAKVVTDRELSDIYAFLRSIPQPPPVGSIPILNR